MEDATLLNCIYQTSQKHNIPVNVVLDAIEKKHPTLKWRAISLGADPLSLMGLPFELQEKIIITLPYDQILHLCRTSPHFSKFCNERVWYFKVISDYGHILPELKMIKYRDTKMLQKYFEEILRRYLNRLRHKRKINFYVPPNKRIMVGQVYLGRGVKTWKHALEQLIILVKWGKVYGPDKSTKKYTNLINSKLWGLMEKKFVNSYGDLYHIVVPLSPGEIPSRFRQIPFKIEISTTEGKKYRVGIGEQGSDVFDPVFDYHFDGLFIEGTNPMFLKYKGKSYKLKRVNYSTILETYLDDRKQFREGRCNPVIAEILSKIDDFVKLLRREFLFLKKISLTNLETNASFNAAKKKFKFDSFGWSLVKIYEYCVRYAPVRITYWGCKDL